MDDELEVLVLVYLSQSNSGKANIDDMADGLEVDREDLDEAIDALEKARFVRTSSIGGGIGLTRRGWESVSDLIEALQEDETEEEEEDDDDDEHEEEDEERAAKQVIATINLIHVEGNMIGSTVHQMGASPSPEMQDLIRKLKDLLGDEG